MPKPLKEVFLNILDEWEKHWKRDIEFFDFLNSYVEINDDLRTYVVKKKKKKVETR